MLSGQKADTKDYVLYDSIYMKFLEKAKLQRESRSEVGLAGDREQGLIIAEYEGTSQSDRRVLKLDCVEGCTDAYIY